MEQGCRGLVIGDLNMPDCEAAAAELRLLGSGEVLSVSMDAGKIEDVQRLLDETLSTFGGVNLACFNAGVGGSGMGGKGGGSMSVLDADIDRWEWVEAVNFWGVLYGSKLFGKYMSEAALADGTEGHIVNTASMAGVTAGRIAI